MRPDVHLADPVSTNAQPRKCHPGVTHARDESRSDTHQDRRIHLKVQLRMNQVVMAVGSTDKRDETHRPCCKDSRQQRQRHAARRVAANMLTQGEYHRDQAGSPYWSV